MKGPTGGFVIQQQAFRMMGEMAARIPAALGKIHSADERERVVHDDHLLMVRGAHRMSRVPVEMEPPVRGELRRLVGDAWYALLPNGDGEEGRQN